MYPLDSVYGPLTYNTFREVGTLAGKGLKSTRQRSYEIYDYVPLTARSYAELIETVSFFSVMNKGGRYTFADRGDIYRCVQPYFAPIGGRSAARPTISQTILLDCS